MPPNQFDLLAAQQPSIAMLGSRSFDDVAPEPNRGIIGTLIHETGLDLLGGARVVGATAGELAGLLGFSVPITYEDLTTRDIKGAVMLAALGAGGVAGGATRGALALADTWIGRATATTISEGVAGAAFGLLQPLEDDQSRLGSIVGNAAFGGAIGMGASMIKSAAKATIGARIAAVRLQASRMKVGEAVKNVEAHTALREIAGVRLDNPVTGLQMGIRRDVAGAVSITYYEPGKKAVTTKAADFGTAVAGAIREGFTKDMRPWDAARALSGMEGLMDEATTKLLAEKGGSITEAIGLAEVGSYKAVREAADLDDSFRREVTALVGETLAPSNPFGAVELPAGTRTSLLQELRLKGKAAAPFLDGSQDGELLRMGAREGLVDIRNIADGAAMNDFLHELVVNDSFSLGVEASDIVVNHQLDAVLTSLLPTQRLAKLFPMFSPVYQAGDQALRVVEKRRILRDQWFYDLGQAVNPEAQAAAVDIIDNTIVQTMDPTSGAMIDDILKSREMAIVNAEATGNPEIVRYVTEVTAKLAESLDEQQVAGLLKQGGRAGYFPIVNANKWKLDVAKWGEQGKLNFQGFHETKEAALAEAARLRSLDPSATGFVSPKTFQWDKGALVGVEPVQMGKMRKAMTEALTEEFGEKEAKATADAMINENFYIKPAAKRLSTPFARERRLGIRDFSKEPMDALRIYFSTTDRALALRDFEAFAKPLIDVLPESQANLKEFGYGYIDRILGRPTRMEKAFDGIMDHIGWDVAPRALRRYTSALRKIESVSRLGGFWSGVVNMSQIGLNTYPVLGLKYTAKGFGALQDAPNAIKTLLENGLDMGMSMPFSDMGEGSRMFFGGPMSALKEKRYGEAFSRMALFVFNKAEQVNRLVTAWGAYQQGLDEMGAGATKAAAQYAQTVMERTQFNYRLSNMPELLSGPLGGLLLQFKSFIINELDFVATMSPKELARFGQAVTTLGGMSLLFNMPGADIANLAPLMWSEQKINEGLQIETQQRDSMAWKVATYGLPGLLGVNMSDQLGVSAVRDATSGFLGPIAKDATALYEFAKASRLDMVETGRVSHASKHAFITAVLPTALRRLTRGAEIASSGEVRSNYSGKLLYQPERRLRESLLTAIGAPSIDMQYELTADAVIQRTSEGYIKARGSFGRDLGMAIVRKDQPAFAQAMADARSAGHIFSGSDVQRWAKEMQRPAAERRLRRTAKVNRADLQSLFDLTGSTEPL